MERYRALLKETWWLWLLLVGFGIGMSFLSSVFLVALPISVCTFFWFAYVRYDEEGNFKGS